MTQLGGSDVIYDNRAESTSGTIGFLTEPFDAPMELTGTVVLDLYLTSDQPDGAIHAYLDAVEASTPADSVMGFIRVFLQAPAPVLFPGVKRTF